MAISRERTEEILRETGVLLEGHFILTSGRHSDKYMQCARILQYPNYAVELIEGLAEAFRDERIDLVVSPATGGIIVGYELARQLGSKNMFTERENGVMTIRRGFTVPEGARVVVAEDVITTGGSVKEVIDLVTEAGGVVVGVAILVDRSNGAIDFGVKTVAAYTAEVISYSVEECPLCKENKLPAVKPGSRGLK